MKRKFPVIWTFLLIIASLWLLNDLKVITLYVPWIPIALIVLSLGMIINRLKE